MLTGSLEGDYNPLSESQSYPAKPKGMSGEERKRLKAEGLLFQEPKSLVALAAGVGRDWPDARGVFASEDRHFAAWVNDEEHVTLVSSRKDGDLKAAFASICAAEKSLGLALQQDGYSFARCDRLGYITGMPERLGTGLSISVTLRLPLMAAGASLLQLVAEHGLKVVGFGRGGIVEVASKATLGVSEADLVSQTAAACTRLLEAEG
uniref:Phosphagen kinase C-terminal domain-containing protein n=1 Tax=Alexandrium catenella TaxID=2925 RepID=A0A7S1LM42_ALECA|mmetsp:Transcript_116529/g.310003  ORF Transcript_116529/g.310003 Transcript_116529/m.310003 type:complete len:207 (+) Transcript_116529:2-622(+)